MRWSELFSNSFKSHVLLLDQYWCDIITYIRNLRLLHSKIYSAFIRSYLFNIGIRDEIWAFNWTTGLGSKITICMPTRRVSIKQIICLMLTLRDRHIFWRCKYPYLTRSRGRTGFQVRGGVKIIKPLYFRCHFDRIAELFPLFIFLSVVTYFNILFCLLI